MKVLCVGLMVCDLLVKPVDPKILKMDTCRAEAVDLKIGGDACNVAVNLQQLGISVKLMSAVGDDFFGRYIMESLTRQKLNTDLIHIYEHDETSRSAVLISENGDRCFISRKGACHRLQASGVTNEILKEFDILYIGSIGDLPGFESSGFADLLRRAKRLGLITVADVTGEADRSAMEKLKEAFPYLDVFLPSIREARNMTGATEAEACLKAFEREGIQRACIKMGEKGSGILENGALHIIPAYPADCVDTTGAGDAFAAGFIAGITLGCGDRKCCDIGNYVGSRVVEQIGAYAELENMETIIKQLTGEV